MAPGQRQILQAYGGGGFRVAGTRHDGSVLILRETTETLAVASLAEVTAEHLAPLLAVAETVELLLVGAGRSLQRLPKPLVEVLAAHGIRADSMDTGAAARTYNVLLAEDRRIAALLIAV